MHRHTRILAVVLVVALATLAAHAELYTYTYGERHWTGTGTPYAHSVQDEGTTYAEIGSFATPGYPVPWTHSDGNGSIEACARASADYGVLKTQSYLAYTDLVQDLTGYSRESFASSALAQYTEYVTVENQGFWAGTGHWHALILEFRLTGSVTTTGQIKPSIRLNGLLPGGEGGEEGEGGGYWEWMGGWGWPAPEGDYDATVGLWIDGYWGETIETGLKLEVSSNNTNLWDYAASGTCMMDFYATCQLETIQVYDVDDDVTVVTFDADGNVIGGNGEGWTATREIPEPTTLLLFAGGALALVRRRRA